MEINSEQFVLGVLSGDAFIQINKKILRYLKGDGSAAVFLGELISMHKYNLNNQTIEPDNSFVCLTRRIQYAVGLSEFKQHRILEKFKECGLCNVRLKGFPATKYVTINFDMLAKILAADDLKYKEIDKQQFYNELNGALNAFHSWSDPTSQTRIVENVEHCCDNMADALKGTIILISKHYIESGGFVNWTSMFVGQVRQWVRNRGLGKPFDFTLVTRTLGLMSFLSIASFDGFISEFIMRAKATQDIHHNNQVYEYRGLL